MISQKKLEEMASAGFHRAGEPRWELVQGEDEIACRFTWQSCFDGMLFVRVVHSGSSTTLIGKRLDAASIIRVRAVEEMRTHQLPADVWAILLRELEDEKVWEEPPPDDALYFDGTCWSLEFQKRGVRREKGVENPRDLEDPFCRLCRLLLALAGPGLSGREIT